VRPRQVHLRRQSRERIKPPIFSTLTIFTSHRSQLFLVTNGEKFKYFERWATGKGFRVDDLICNGATIEETRLGDVADVALCLRADHGERKDSTQSVEEPEDVCVIAGDTMIKVCIRMRNFN
jgi:hypothetical protein